MLRNFLEFSSVELISVIGDLSITTYRKNDYQAPILRLTAESPRMLNFETR